MGISKLHRKNRRSGGFALIEAIIAIAILAVGLLGVAALLAQLGGNSTQSRYMSTEALLASEKLDDLNRLPFGDPAIAVPNGNTAGSLTADVTDTVTVGAFPAQVVDYFDQVRVSAGNGNMVETVSGLDVNGKTVFTTTAHAPDGSITVTTSSTAPNPTPDMLVFARHWVIEQNVAGLPAGVRRFTVLVSLVNPVLPATFQSSMLR
jgi:Tfp pilus assembly protein PilV